MPESYWLSIGYLCLNNFALRIDVFERVFFLARQKIKFGPFLESSSLMNPIGCNASQLQNILAFCGFNCVELGGNKKLFYAGIKKKIEKNNLKKKKSKSKVHKIDIKKKLEKKKIKADPNSPFAVLEKLL